MNLVQSLINFVSKKKTNPETTAAPEGLCPNCWGNQEYEGRFIDALDDERVDLNNINLKKGWIQEYATRHFDGIKLEKSHDKYECPRCKLIYK